MIAGIVLAVSFALIGFGLRTLIVGCGSERDVANGAACLGSGIAGIGLCFLVLLVIA